MARLSYLLDTNVLSEPLAKTPNPGVVQNLEVLENWFTPS
ncbi:hypothetical protein Thiosp_02639 [Thiorhodovibrio litoralis]|nr:hypothetical protein Thiosp_02639 [Thiorhodovibrio litoralis]